MKKFLICFLLSTILLTGCLLSNSKDSGKNIDNNSDKTISENSTNISKKDTSEEEKANTSDENNTISESTNTTDENSNIEDTDDTSNEIIDIDKEVKNYILNEQGNIPKAQKIKWSERFLNKVNINDMYNKYLSNGGVENDIKAFATFMTQNVTPPDNWQELFEQDLYDKYGEKVTKLEHLQDDLYQSYIEKYGSEIPYVVVSSKTGYFHS